MKAEIMAVCIHCFFRRITNRCLFLLKCIFEMSRTLYPMTQRFIAWFSRPILLCGLLLSIPAFYLLLAGETDVYRKIGHGTYIFSALIIAVDVYLQWAKNRHRRRRRHGKLIMDAIIIIGCVLSGWPTSGEWGVIEWLLRLSLHGDTAENGNAALAEIKTQSSDAGDWFGFVNVEHRRRRFLLAGAERK